MFSATLATEKATLQTNYGLLMEKMGNVEISGNYWAHTFQLALPTTHMSKTVISHCESKQNTTETEVFCAAKILAVNQTNKIKSATEHTLDHALHTIESIMPHHELSPSKTMSKRTLLPFIGDISATLFGTARQKDVQILAQHITQMEKNKISMISSIQQHNKHMSSYMQAIDERLNNIVSEITFNHDNLQQFDLKLATLSESFIKSVQLSIFLSEQNHKANIIQMKIKELIDGVYALSKGKLSPNLLPPDTIDMAVKQINSILENKYPGFRIINLSPTLLYEQSNFVAVRRHHSIYITLKFYMTSLSAPLKLYKVQSFPVPVNVSNSQGTHLTDIPDFFAISQDNTYYLELSKESWSQCIGTTQLYYCTNSIPLVHASEPSCMSSLYFHDTKNIKVNCHFDLIPNSIQPMIQSMPNDQMLIQQINTLTLNCRHSGISTIKGCNFCLMAIPCHCSVTADKFYLAPRLSQCENTSSVTTHHPLNMALLLHFFSDDELENIRGDTLFDQPVQIQIPNISLYNHEYSKFLSTDKKVRLNLSKVANAVKNGNKIYQSVADPMLDNLAKGETS